MLAHLKGTLVDTYDRVGWYLTQFISPVPAFQPYTPRCWSARAWTPSPNSFLDDVCVMWAMAKQGLQKTKDVRAFYKSRVALRRLPRGAAPRARPAHAARGSVGEEAKTWISVGCGTARDVEFVTGHVKAAGTKVYLVDLSDAVARHGARAGLGLQTQVVLVEGDINLWAVRKKLPKADLVTCSYCLTMIPWKEALATMLDLVEVMQPRAYRLRHARGGKRFFQNCTSGGSMMYFNRGHVDRLRSQKNLATIWYSRRRAACPTRPTAPRTTSTAPKDGVSAARTSQNASRAEARRIFLKSGWRGTCASSAGLPDVTRRPRAPRERVEAHRVSSSRRARETTTGRRGTHTGGGFVRGVRS